MDFVRARDLNKVKALSHKDVGDDGVLLPSASPANDSTNFSFPAATFDSWVHSCNRGT